MGIRMAFVGESWGEEEARQHRPFVGKSGYLLNTTLRQLGIEREECLVTNCFNFQPPENKIAKILVTRDKAAPGWPRLGLKYLPPELVPEIERMRSEVRLFQPDGIVALGAIALWGLTGSSDLGTQRGHVQFWEGIPMVPTYHPARCLRQYSLKTSMVADILKAKRLAAKEIEIEPLNFIAEPTIVDIKQFFQRIREIGITSVDIETIPASRAITMIGFGLQDFSICVPFVHEAREGFHYWATIEEEIEAMREVKSLLADKLVRKIFHHGAYDIAWIADVWGMEICGAVYDTRIMHANMLAELPHTLTDVAAQYLVMPPWKNEWRSAKESDATREISE